MAPPENSRPKAAESKTEQNQGNKYPETRSKRKRKGENYDTAHNMLEKHGCGSYHRGWSG